MVKKSNITIFFYFCLATFIATFIAAVTCETHALSPVEGAEAIERFLQYLQIKSVHPTPDYASTMQFLVRQAERIGLAHSVVEMGAGGKPLVIMEWSHPQFTDRSAKSILLNSHTDVVPVDLESWNYDPFAAHYNTTTGQIFARGSQDMKVCGGMV